MVKEKGKCIIRKDPRINVGYDIFVYSYKHGAGIWYLYENRTADKVLS